MLLELRVTNLGVIEDQTVVFGSGLTALTGETGAGKTLLVDAISLLTGGPVDPGLVAPGASEARVEGRFALAPPRAGSTLSRPGTGFAPTQAGEDEADELILTRVVPASGRSRCYLDGRMVSAAQLLEVGRGLVDIHGQHAHQSLLAPGAARRALDQAAGIDITEVQHWRQTIRGLTLAQAGLGGDPRERARQLDLLAYQLQEIEAADLADPEEDATLIAEEEMLADAGGLSDTALQAWEALAGDDGVIERLGAVVSATATRRPLADIHQRLAGLQEELVEAAREGHHLAESVEDDPARLAWIGDRRRVLTELRRKYGSTLGDVIAYEHDVRQKVDELAAHDRRAAELDTEMEGATKELTAATERVTEARQAAAPGLSRAVEAELRTLAMPRARFEIEVDPDPAHESVTWLLSANPGQALQPLAKVASGGELARAMLATRLVMGPGADADPVTLVFDEVDAGIGGEAAVAVGRALAALAADRQVLVVTHLAQVAALAASHLHVSKDVLGAAGDERTVAAARPLEGQDRVVELARMLSGRPDSDSARRHAAELLASAVPATAPSPKSRRRRR